MNINETNTNTQYMDDEIDLKELILAIWKRKILIISITIIFTLLAGVYTFFLASPVYNTKMNVIVNMPETYLTRYGEYKLPLETNEQYIKLFTSNDVLAKTIQELELTDKMNVEGLRNSIAIKNSFNNSQNGNSFEITVSSDTPSGSLQLANALYKNYKEFLDIMIKEQVIDYFYDSFTIELITIKDNLDKEQQILKANEALLSEIKMELSTEGSNIGIVDSLGGNAGYVVPTYTINPNYIKLETDVINSKQVMNELTNTLNMKQKYMIELEKEKEAIQQFYDIGKANPLSVNLISIVETNVNMPSLPIEPLSKSSPSTVKNIGIGIVLGGLVGVMIALFQWYWRKES